mmetsp:Transcript_35802/g.41504  ORF Transcript_35802/g.41504 Transcript_35802/m.41504 type:complete len:200 (+) Transcript_35802:166-765(+)
MNTTSTTAPAIAAEAAPDMIINPTTTTAIINPWTTFMRTIGTAPAMATTNTVPAIINTATPPRVTNNATVTTETVDTTSVVSRLTTATSATIDTSSVAMSQQQYFVKNVGGRHTGAVSKYVNKELTMDGKTMFTCAAVGCNYKRLTKIFTASKWADHVIDCSCHDTTTKYNVARRHSIVWQIVLQNGTQCRSRRQSYRV